MTPRKPLFIAQALGFDLYLRPATKPFLLVAMLTSKGASGITGAGPLSRSAATLAVVDPRFGARHGHRSGYRQVHERMPRP